MPSEAPVQSHFQPWICTGAARSIISNQWGYTDVAEGIIWPTDSLVLVRIHKIEGTHLDFQSTGQISEAGNCKKPILLLASSNSDMDIMNVEPHNSNFIKSLFRVQMVLSFTERQKQELIWKILNRVLDYNQTISVYSIDVDLKLDILVKSLVRMEFLWIQTELVLSIKFFFCFSLVQLISYSWWIQLFF